MKFFTSSFFVVVGLLLASDAPTLRGQSEALQIVGPQQAAPGSLIRLSAKTAHPETPFWIVLEPIDLDYEQVDGGRRLIFTTGCQATSRITVLLLAQQVKDNRIVTRQTRRTITVGQRPPGAEPNPPGAEPKPPGGEPKPPTDPPRTDWESSPLFSGVLQVWPTIRTDAAKALSEKIADNFERVAGQIDNQTITQPEQIWTVLSQLNRDVLKIETSAWQPVGQTVQRLLKQLKLSRVKAHSFHLRAAAAAIRAAHQSSINPTSALQ